MLAQTDRDERLNWSIKENCSIFGKPFVTSKILMACSNAFLVHDQIFKTSGHRLSFLCSGFTARCLLPAAYCSLNPTPFLTPTPIFIC